MAKWFVVSNDGEALMQNGRDGAEALEFDNGREACNYAASFLIPFSEHAVSAPTPEGKALSEADVDITELSVICMEKGVRIRMTREPLGLGETFSVHRTQ